MIYLCISPLTSEKCRRVLDKMSLCKVTCVLWSVAAADVNFGRLEKFEMPEVGAELDEDVSMHLAKFLYCLHVKEGFR